MPPPPTPAIRGKASTCCTERRNAKRGLANDSENFVVFVTYFVLFHLVIFGLQSTIVKEKGTFYL
jgi:hypothetical protein